MCLQDVAIGLKTASNVVKYTAGLAASNVLGVNSKRRSIVFLPPIAGTATFDTNSTVTSGNGINVAAGAAPVILSRDTIGQIVGEAWFCIGDAAGRTGSVIESTVDEAIYKLAMHHAFNK